MVFQYHAMGTAQLPKPIAGLLIVLDPLFAGAKKLLLLVLKGDRESGDVHGQRFGEVSASMCLSMPMHWLGASRHCKHMPHEQYRAVKTGIWLPSFNGNISGLLQCQVQFLRLLTLPAQRR